MGKKGGGGQQQTNTDPWKAQQPYLKKGFELVGGTNGRWEGPENILQMNSNGDGQWVVNPDRRWIGGTQGLVDKPMQYYGGQMVADRSPYTTQAIDMIRDRATAGSQYGQNTQNYLADVMAGKYLNPESNPALGHYINKGMESIIPSMDTSAINAGRYGSGAWAMQKGNALGEMTADIYGQAYEGERGRQMQAAGMMPQITAADYRDAQILAGLGADDQAYQQALLDAERQKFEWEQMEPWKRAQMYTDLISGNYGGTTSTPMYGQSTAGSIANAGMAGLGAYGLASGAGLAAAGPIGLGIGALSLLG